MSKYDRKLNLTSEFNQLLAERQKLEGDLEKKKEADEKLHQNLKNFIETTTDMEDILNAVCEHLKKFTSATGVYVGSKDLNRETVTDDDDELAHLGKLTVIRFTNWCEDHSFLKGKCLQPGEGVAFDLFKEEDNANQPLDNPDEPNPQIKEDMVPLIVPEVIREPRIKFFREPKLGSFVALNISYQSSMYKQSLDSAIENSKDFEAKLKDYKLRVQEFEERKAKKEKDMVHNSEILDNQPLSNNTSNIHVPNDDGVVDDLNNLTAEWGQIESETPVLKEHIKYEKNYLVCLDTLGQDRTFTENEVAFAREICKTIRNSWQNLESRLLLKDRDIRVNLLNQEKSFIEENPIDKLIEREDKYLKSFFAEKYALESKYKLDL